MKRMATPSRFFLILFWLCQTALAQASSIYNSAPGGDNVEVLSTYSDFESKVLQDDFLWMIQFYDSGAHASALSQQAPLYASISQVLKGLFHIGAVDVATDEGQKIGATYQVSPGGKSPTIVMLMEDKQKPVETITKTDSLRPEEVVQKLANHASKLLMSRMGMPSEEEEEDTASSSSESSSSGGSQKRKTAFKTVTGSEFDDLVLNNPQVVLVAFTAPWCGHCKRLEPEFKQAGKALAGEEVLLAWVNAEEERGLSSTYGVQGFPTIKLFRGGTGKTPQDGHDFMYERTAPSITAAILEEVAKTGVVKEIPELLNASVLKDECQGANHICVLAALPHILDSGAEGRNKYRDLLATVSKSFKGTGAFSFLWFEGGGVQPGLEKAFDLTFGFPALIAFSMDRKAFAVLHGAFAEKQISGFLHSITTGRQATIKMDDIPKIESVDAWDGKDGAPIEEEFDLSDLFDDDEPEL